MMDLERITLKAVTSVYREKGYVIRQSNAYVNVFGIRAVPGRVDSFDDAIGLFWFKDYGEESHFIVFPATTDPGLYYLNNPERTEGTAIMCEGQHLSVYALGLHQGKYECLKQVRAIPFYRDNNRDNNLNPVGNAEPQIIGANIHSTKKTDDGHTITVVGKFSAACQVIQEWHDFEKFMYVCKGSSNDNFDYTLFNENDIKNYLG